MAGAIKGITVEIGGDTTKLGKAISESEKKTRSLQGELRQIDKLLQFDPTNTELLAQKQQALAEMVESTSKKLNTLKEAEEQVVAQFERGEIGENQLREFQREIIKTEQDMSNLSDALYVATRNLEEFGDNNGVSNELKQLADSAEAAGDSAKESSEGFTVMKGVLANLEAEGIKRAIDGLKTLASLTNEWDEASNTFQARTGASTTEMIGFNKAMEDVYKNNFGDSMAEVADAMAKVKEVTGEINPSKLQQMTESAMTLEDTFEMDMQETLRGVNSLMDHFGLTSEQAFDLISSGAQNGLNYTDELGDNLAEYAGKFAEAGYSAEEYFQLLKNGADGGAYNLDKINDAINEVTTRLADGTIQDGLSGFSKGTQDVFKSWQNGGATQKEVIDSIVKDIQNTTNEQEKMNLAALAFGTMAEDGGTKFIDSLTSIGDSFDNVKGKMNEIKELRYDDIGSALSGLGRTVETDLINPIGEKLTPKIEELINYINSHSEEINGVISNIVDKVGEFIDYIASHGSEIISIISGIAAGLLAWNVASMISGVVSAIKAYTLANEGATIAQALFNAVMNANPIVLIVSLITMLVVGIVTFIATNEEAREKLAEVWKTIKTTVGGVVDALVEFFTVKIPEAFNSFVNLVKSLPTKIKTIFTQTIPNLISKAIQFFKDMPEKIGYAIGYAIGTLIKWGVKMNETVREAVPKIISSVINFFKKLPSKIWNAIVSAVLGIAKWTLQMREKAQAGMKKVATAVIEGIKNLPQKMKETGKNIVQGLWNGIKNMVSWVKEKVKGFANSLVDGVKDALGIHSPSRVFEKEVGEQIAAGVIKGIENKSKDVKKSADKMANELIESVKNSKSNARKSAEDINNIFVTAAKNKINELKKSNKLSTADEVVYWQTILSHCKKGTKAYIEAYSQYNKAKTNQDNELVKSAKDRADELKKQNKLNEVDEIAYWETILKSLNKGTQAHKDATAQLSNAKKTLNNEVKKLNDEYTKDSEEVSNKLQEDIDAVTNEYVKSVTDRANAIKSSMGLFDAFEAKEGIEKNTLIDNLKSQVEALKEWDSTLDSIRNRNGMDTNLLTDLEGMGVDSLDTLKQVNAMSDEELAEYIELYKQKNLVALERSQAENEALKAQTEKEIEDLKSTAETKLNQLKETYAKKLRDLGLTANTEGKNIGKNITKGIENGLKSGQGTLFNTLTKLCDKMVAQAMASLQIHSPSRLFRDMVGKQIPAGISQGIEEGTGGAIDSINSMSDLIYKSAEDFNGATINRKLNATFDTSSAALTLSEVVDTIKIYGDRLIDASNKQIVLDTGTLVGETIDKIDVGLANNQSLKARGV